MSLNPRVFDTAILNRSTSSRAVTANGANGANNNFKIDPDGLLIAAPMIDYNRCFLKISHDDGYTWTNKGGYYLQPRSASFAEGTCYQVFYDKEDDWTTILYAGYNQLWIITDDNAGNVTTNTPYGEVQVKYGTYNDKPAGNFMAMDGDFPIIYCAYVNSSTNQIKITGIDVMRGINDCIQDLAAYTGGTPVLGTLAIKSKEDKVHLIAGLSSSLSYIPFTKKKGSGTGSFGTANSIDTNGSARDVGIDINGEKHLGVIYSIDTGTGAIGFYATSTNSGSTWNKIGLIPPSGYSSIYDPLTNKYSLRSSIVGGYDDSFLISNCYKNSTTNNIDVFVKEINPTDSGILLNDIPTQSGMIGIGPNGYIGIYENSSWNQITPVTSSKLNDIVYGDSKFVAVGNSGVIVTSNDGRNWTQRTTETTQDLYAVAYNPSGAFCAVGASGTVLTSTNGITWTEEFYIAPTINLKGITTFNPYQYWVVVGNDNGSNTSRLYTSNTLNGTAWTSRTIGHNQIWNDITSSPTLLVIVGNNGTIYTSGDGITWTARSSGTSEHLNSVSRSTARFVAVGNNGAVTISSTGTTWYIQSPAPTSQDLLSSVPVGSGMYIGASGYYANSAGGLIPYTTISSGSEVLNGLSYGIISGVYYGYGTTPVSTSEWKKVNSVEGNVLGAKFFKYIHEAIPNFGDKSTIRMAYQLGNQNDKDGQDSVSSTIFQESLGNNAYPELSGGDAFTKGMYDYYASGHINDQTKIYMRDFDKIGTTVSVSKYEPLSKSVIDGKAGFSTPETFDVTALIDPGSSTAPTVARGNAEFEEYIGRDSRKIFFKPDCYLNRNYIINEGGYKKKTVYTIRLEDKDYQVEQILPRFYNNAIIYWEANLFVVSPTNDPFKG